MEEGHRPIFSSERGAVQDSMDRYYHGVIILSNATIFRGDICAGGFDTMVMVTLHYCYCDEILAVS